MNYFKHLFILSIIPLFFSCTVKVKRDYDIAPTIVAKECYDSLLAGNYEYFVDMRYQPHVIPEEYRNQLIIFAKQHITELQSIHEGIDSFSVVKVVPDSTYNLYQSYIGIHFNDGTSEEMLIPMVKVNGEWKMK